MQRLIYLLALGGVSGLDKNRPVNKVIQLLRDMKDQLLQDKEKDEGIYDRLRCWCEKNDKEKSQEIREAESQMKQLSASIEELTARESNLRTVIRGESEELKEQRQSLEEAVSLREKQRSEFNEEEKATVEYIKALDSAIVVLSKHHGEAEAALILRKLDGLFQKSSLLGSTMVSEAHRLKGFLQQPHNDPYSSRSGEVFGILKQMKETFQKNLQNGRENEFQSQSDFNALKSAKQREIATAEQALENKRSELTDTIGGLATAKQDLKDTRNSLSSDGEFLLLVKQTCRNTEREWGERTQTRNEEIEAVNEAIRILSSDVARDTFTRTFNPNLESAQARAPAYIQISRHIHKELSKKRLVGSLLHRKGVPASLARHVVALVGLNDFSKVKQAIHAMIADLSAKKEQEAEQRDWCTAEIGANDKDSLEEKNALEHAEARMEVVKSEVTNAASEIQSLEGQVKEMDDQLKMAKETRERESVEYREIRADQVETIELLEQALVVLEKFYVHRGTPTTSRPVNVDDLLPSPEERQAFVHIKGPARDSPPPSFETYKAAGGTGVMALIGQIVDDAKRMVRESDQIEGEAVARFSELTLDSAKNIAAKKGEITNKQAVKAQLETDQMAIGKDIEITKGEILSLSNQSADLNMQCSFLLRNFSVRQEGFADEIEALHQTIAVLSGAHLEVE